MIAIYRCLEATTTLWRRLIECLKLHVVFRKRATNYKALSRKIMCKDKTSYGGSPTCICNDFRSNDFRSNDFMQWLYTQQLWWLCWWAKSNDWTRMKIRTRALHTHAHTTHTHTEYTREKKQWLNPHENTHTHILYTRPHSRIHTHNITVRKSNDWTHMKTRTRTFYIHAHTHAYTHKI